MWCWKTKDQHRKKNLENKKGKVYQHSFVFFYHFYSICVSYCLLGYSHPSLCRPVSSTLGKNFEAERKLQELWKFCEIRVSTPSRRVWGHRVRFCHGFRSTDWGKGEASCCSSGLDIEHYAWFNLTCYHPPRAIPRGKSSSSSSGVGNCLKRYCPGGRKWGKSKTTTPCYFSRGLHEAAELKTTYFKGKTQEFIGEWLERNNLSKLKFLFERMF